MMKVKNCEECNKEFEYEPPKGFPDKRKYCRACSEKKKQQWDERDGKVDAPVVKVFGKMEEKDIKCIPTEAYIAPKEKEFHLSPEEVKCRALECAIEMVKKYEMKYNEEELMEMADKFVKWIYAQ